MSKSLLLFLLLTGCSFNYGPHVTTEIIQLPPLPQPPKLLYVCKFSDHWYSWDRKIAYCDSFEKCNETCAALGAK